MTDRMPVFGGRTRSPLLTRSETRPVDLPFSLSSERSSVALSPEP